MFVFLIIFFIFFLNKIFSSYILFPFETENLGTNIIQSKYDINLHAHLEVGIPIQKIKIYFRDDFFSFFILNRDTIYNDEEIMETNIPSEFKKVDEKNLYNNKVSSTYKNISNYKNFFIDIYYRKGFLSSDIFYFNESNNLKRYDNIEFVLVNKIKPNRTLISGAIGLLVDEYNLEGAQSFARMLVKKNVTSYCVWSKIYFNNDSGVFIFGDYPHLLFNDKFYDEQYVETDIKLNVYKQKWNLAFNEIFVKISYNNRYKDLYLNTTLYGELRHNFGLIIGTQEYHSLIFDVFFKYKLKEGICGKDEIFINDFNDNKINHIYYYCNNIETFRKENFPKLFLKQKELNYIFELDDKDLFILQDEKWYFMIIFEGEETVDQMHKWFFGEPLLKKYNFIFDPINYKIGFYNPNIPVLNKESKKKREENNNIFDQKRCLLIVILLIFVTILIFLHILTKQWNSNNIKRNSYTELQNLTIQKD